MVIFTFIYFLQKYLDMINKNDSSILLDLNESNTKGQILKYRKSIQIMLFILLFFLLFFNRFE